MKRRAFVNNFLIGFGVGLVIGKIIASRKKEPKKVISNLRFWTGEPIRFI